MKQLLLDSPRWARALSLNERTGPGMPPPAPVSAAGLGVARRRWERWQAQYPFAEDGFLERRLAQDGLAATGILALLAEPAEALESRSSGLTPWTEELRAVFSYSSDDQSADAAWWRARPHVLRLVAPVMRRATDRLRSGIDALTARHGSLPWERETTAACLVSGLTARLSAILGRTMAVELHVAGLEGKLAGGSAEERFASFVERLGRPEVAAAILAEYPVLARQVWRIADLWVDFGVEFLGRLAADWPQLVDQFFAGEEPGQLSEVTTGVSDSHGGGRSTILLQFSSGQRLVYKPKALAVDVAFQKLLVWTEERGFTPRLRPIEVLDRGSYGWTEFVDAADCPSPERVARFYQRQGGLLALLSLLEATDFHQENLIAAGEHPVLVDLEALFHPELVGGAAPAGSAARHNPGFFSVLRVGLLPQRTWDDEESVGVDLSGLGGEGGQQTPRPVLQVDGEGTASMRYVRRHAEIPAWHNRARLDGENVDPVAYSGEVVAGFERMYRVLIDHRRELLAADGPLAAFSGVETRVIVRPTRTYALLLAESYHPQLLRDAVDRDRHFDHLWAAVVDRPHLEGLIPAERRALLDGDVPMFTTRTDERDLTASDGTRFHDFCAESGMERVRRRAAALGEVDLRQQLRVIEGTFAAVAASRGDQAWPSFVLREGQRPSSSRLLAAARGVGDELAALSYLDGERAAFFARKPVAGGAKWAHEPVGVDLYGGLPGIALFLAYLANAADDRAAEELARQTLRGARRMWADFPARAQPIGAFGGWGGILYSLTHLAALWREPTLWAEAEAVVERLSPLIDGDELLDVTAGAAGCLLALLAFDAVHPSPLARDAARRCGDRLLELARPMEEGLAWSSESTGHQALTGMAHGAAGIAWSLAALASATGEARYRRAAERALTYERALFSPEEGNWPDLRAEDGAASQTHGGGGDRRYLVGWCHGAPGIGLARLGGLPLLDGDTLRQEVRVAVETTLRLGFGWNHSLCHGDLGNLELLLQTAAKLGEPALADRAARLTTGLLSSVEQDGPLLGAPRGAEIPGLMTGLAGVGFGLLRLAAPDRVPAVLLLEPPPGG